MADGYASRFNQVAYDASTERRLDAAGWTQAASGLTRSGRRPGSGLDVSVLTSPDRIQVAAGRALVEHPTLGAYRYALLAATAKNLPARPASGTSRIDLVTVQIFDADSGATSLREPQIVVVSGTAAASPVAPDITNLTGSPAVLVLATLTVPATGTIAVTQNGPRTVASGGIVPVLSQADRDLLQPYDGLKVYRLDTGKYESRAGGAWVVDPTSVDVSAINATVRRYDGTETQLFGASKPPAGTVKIIREGSSVLTTTSGSFVTIPVPAAIANGITYISLLPGDIAQSLQTVTPNLAGSSLTNINALALARGNAAIASQQIRVNWQIVGW